jgi:hypothetical protein
MISFTVAIIALNFGGTKSNPTILGASQGVVFVWAFILLMSGLGVLGVELIWRSPRSTLELRRLIPHFQRNNV